MNKCKVCGIEISDKAKTCSSKCRVTLSRQCNTSTVTPSPSVTNEPGVRIGKHEDSSRSANTEQPIAEQGLNLDTCSDSVLEEYHRQNSDPRLVKIYNEAAAKIRNYGQSDCECMHCQSHRLNRNLNTINHGRYKSYAQLNRREVNRVPLPGDSDYKGVCPIQEPANA